MRCLPKRHLAALLVCIGLGSPAMAQRSIDLGAAFDAVSNLAKSQSVGNMSEPEEISIGRDVAASTMGSYRLIRHEALNRNLNRIGLWVALQSSRPLLPWRFAAVDSAAINAFAAPGGFIMVTRGMLETVSNEAELACVLGHEIGHVSRRHHLEVLQKSLLAEAGANAIAAYTNSGSTDLRNLVLSQGKEIFSKGLDRSAESEADQDGVLLAAKAGYDPAACLTFMQRLAGMKGESNALASLYKTHPSAADRSTDIEAALKRLQGAKPGTGARPLLNLTAAANGKKK